MELYIKSKFIGRVHRFADVIVGAAKSLFLATGLIDDLVKVRVLRGNGGEI